MQQYIYKSILLILLVVAVCHGCGRQSATTTTTPRPRTTTPTPVQEETIQASSATSQQGANAWSSGGRIDWSHVAAGGQASGSRPGTTSTSNSGRGSSSSTSGSSSSGPLTPQSVSRSEMRNFAQELFNADTNRVGSMITLNTQGTTSQSATSDVAPQRLFSQVSPQALRGPTISKLWELLDNYNPQVTQAETTTTQEEGEIEDFLNAVIDTNVMRKTNQFLTSKGFIRRPIKTVLKELWFTPYPRSGRTLSSSAFEHVFVGEIKHREVSGFHNWLSFYKEEQEGDVDYFGHMKFTDLGHDSTGITLKFKWGRDPKAMGSMLVGTSPELDMALFTVCYFARPNGYCPIQANGHRFSIKTYYLNYNGKRYIGTAFPLV